MILLKRSLIILAGMCLTITIHAQGNLTDEEKKKFENGIGPEQAKTDTIWKLGGTAGLNISQSYFSNWAAGGQNTFSFTALTSLFAKYNKGKHSWETTLDMAYGQLSQGDKDPIKTDDRFDLTSKYGIQAKNPHWYYSVLFNFRTQFAPGYEIEDGDELEPKISDLLAPAFSILSPGIDYKPNDKFSALLSPITLKTTIVIEDRLVTDYGVEEGENVRFEPGAFLKLQYQDDIAQNVNLLTRLDLFTNYAENFGNIDVNWETLITLKVNNWLNTTITTQLIYDDDINIGQRDPVLDENGEIVEPGVAGGPRTQFREVLAVGLTATF